MANIFSGLRNPFKGPDVSTLTTATADDRQRAAEFFRQLQLLQQNYNQAYGQQSALGRSYDQAIAGTAPSVAQRELRQNVDVIGNQARSTAAGASGNTAPLATYGAINAIGAAGAKANQDAAILRAKEIEEARKGKAALLGQQQAATGQMAGINAGGATSLSGTATTGATNLANLDANELAAQRNFYTNLLSGGGAGLVSMAAR